METKNRPWAKDYDWQLGQPELTRYGLAANVELDGAQLDEAQREALAKGIAAFAQTSDDGAPGGGTAWYDGGARVYFDGATPVIASNGEDACEAIEGTSPRLLAAIERVAPDARVTWEQRPPEPIEE